MAQGDSYYTIGVLGKAFMVIELMTQKAQWELGELSKACGLPKSTLQRILLTLDELGYVRQICKGGAYSLTLNLFKIGRRIVSNNSLIGQARPICRNLLETVNETVNLCIALNTEMVVVDQQVSHHMLRLDSIIGTSFSVYRSASGKTFTAFLEEAEALQMIESIRQNHKEVTDQDIADFQAEMALIRQEGVGFDYEEVFAGVRCVAAPIFDYSGEIMATIGCSVPTIRITPELSELLIREIARAAETLSRTLGAPARTFALPSKTMFPPSKD